MAERNSKGASTKPRAPVQAEPLFRAGLDALSFGFAVFDKDLKLVNSNKTFQTLRDYPAALCKPGTEIAKLYRFNAERGDYGPGDIGAHVKSRLIRARKRRSHELECELATGRILSIRYKPIARGGLLISYADVTERKRAEQVLAESQERLQAPADYMQVALSSMSDGIFILDGDLNIVAFNQKYVDLLDFPEGLVREGGSIVDAVEFAAKRGDYGNQFDGDIDDVVAGRLKQMMSKEEILIENITPTGRIVEYRGSPIKGGGFVTIMHDITERKQAEEALRESEQLLATILDHMPTPVYLRDVDGRFMLINRRYEDIHQVTRDDVRGKTLGEIFPRSLAEELGTLDPEVVKQRRVLEGEETHQFTDGEHTLVVVKFPIFNPSGEVVAVGGVDVDITERKRAAKALQRAQEEAERARAQLNEAIESISEGFVLFDADDRIVLCNSVFQGFFPDLADLVVPGSRFEDIVRAGVERGLFPHAEGRAEPWLEEIMEHRRNFGILREQYLTGGLWLQISDRPTADGGLVAVYTDVTELKQRQEELSVARDAAMQATRAKSQFLANMSHELRTPMNAIIGFTRLVMRRSKKDLEAKQYENLEKVLSSSEHLLLLINDILDLSKIEAGQITILPTEFALETLIDDCLRTAEPLVKSDGVQLVQEVDTDLPMIFTDEDKVRQILLNLLSNAIKFTEKGCVTVRARRHNEMMAIEVSDTGIGIPEEALKLIFEEFGQTKDGSARRHGGTGLGLAITRHLAQLLGGDITVESISGAGSTFTVTILQRYAAEKD